MTILITGGSGKTSSRITSLLQASSVPVLVASRKGTAPNAPAVRFDWLDEATYGNPFVHAIVESSPLEAAYLVIPDEADSAVKGVEKFIELARSRGVRRFVLLSSSAVEAGGPYFGQVHEYLRDSGLEWTVLRPTWFQENFVEQTQLQAVAKNTVFSAAGNGKIPFVSADDIAAVGARALMDEKPHNRDYLILGPELLSYSDVASILSEVLGRPITHKCLTEEELRQRIIDAGYPSEFANVLAVADTEIANGSENRLSDDVEKLLGRKPISFREFAIKNRGSPTWKAS